MAVCELMRGSTGTEFACTPNLFILRDLREWNNDSSLQQVHYSPTPLLLAHFCAPQTILSSAVAFNSDNFSRPKTRDLFCGKIVILGTFIFAVSRAVTQVVSLIGTREKGTSPAVTNSRQVEVASLGKLSLTVING